MLWFLACKANGILATPSEVTPPAPALEGGVPTTTPPGTPTDLSSELILPLWPAWGIPKGVES